MSEKNEPRERVSKVVMPFAGVFVDGAVKLGDAVEGAVLWGFKNHGTAGTGRSIKSLAGAVADRAARAAIGGGPERLGGLGIAGGNSRLAMVGNVVAGVVIVGAAAAVYFGDLKLDEKPTAPAHAGTCQKCGQTLPLSVDGTENESNIICLHCGHEETNQA